MSQLNRDYKTIINEYEREQPRGQQESGWWLYVAMVFIYGGIVWLAWFGVV